MVAKQRSAGAKRRFPVIQNLFSHLSLKQIALKEHRRQ
jgi:hypothetical protein